MQHTINEEDQHKYISNETNPFIKLSKFTRVGLGLCVGFTIASLANKINRQPYLTRPHRHLFYMTVCSLVLYKTYDFNDYITKRDIYTLSIPQQRVREQEDLKRQLEQLNQK